MTDCRLVQQNGNPAIFPNHYQSKIPICKCYGVNPINKNKNNKYNNNKHKAMSLSRESFDAKQRLLHCVDEQEQQQQQQQQQRQQQQRQQYSSLTALAQPWLERTTAAVMHSTRRHVGSHGLRRITGLSESK